MIIVSKVTEANREELKRLKKRCREDYVQRIPIEGKFGHCKNGYNLDYIRAKRADTSLAWFNSIFLMMNLLILFRIFFALQKQSFVAAVITTITRWWNSALVMQYSMYYNRQNQC